MDIEKILYMYEDDYNPSSMVPGPRNMYAGGQLVSPSDDGSRPGYSGMPDNVKKTPYGTYYYLRGKGENKVYRGGFDTPEAASKWGQKEFVKKFALPKKFVSASELTALLDVGTGEGSGMRSPFFERGDRPNYLLKEARKILGSYQAGKSNFFKAPTKKQIEYLKKYSKAPLIQENLAKNVQIILDSKAIMNDLTGKNKGGAKLPEFNKVIQVFKNAGVNASDAQITNALQKAAYLLRGNTFQTDVKFNVDKKTGNFIVKELEKLPFDNQYARGIYKHALNEIREELGDTAGNLESFKRNLRKRLPDGFLQKHNLEINEVFSVRASAKNKSFPYAYFIDATDAEINKKALRSFHGALSRAQTDLNNKISDIRAGKAKYDDAVEIIEKFQKTRSKFKNTIETNYPGKNFNLADIVLGKESEVLKKNMKIPEDVYSKKLLDKWKNQGLDITGHAKKTGYVMTGADNPGVFTAQDLSRDKNVRNAMLEFAGTITDKCKIDFSKGGRIGFNKGSADCLRIAKEGLEKGLKTGFPKNQQVLAEGILKSGRFLKDALSLRGLFGPAALAFTAAAEAGIVGYDMLSTGKSFREAVGDSLFNYMLGDRIKIDSEEEFIKRLKNIKTGPMGYRDFSDEEIGKMQYFKEQLKDMGTGFNLYDQLQKVDKKIEDNRLNQAIDPSFFSDTAFQLDAEKDKIQADIRDYNKTGTPQRVTDYLLSDAATAGADAAKKAELLTRQDQLQDAGIGKFYQSPVGDEKRKKEAADIKFQLEQMYNPTKLDEFGEYFISRPQSEQSYIMGLGYKEGGIASLNVKK